MNNIPTFGNMTPYPHQWEVVQSVNEFIRKQFQAHKRGDEIKNAYVNASVSSGKSLMMGCTAARSHQFGIRCMILTAVGELADQNGQEMFSMGVPFSYYSAYVGVKSTSSTNISGTVGSVLNAIKDGVINESNAPHILNIDECHMVNIEDIETEGKTQFAQVIKLLKQLNPMLVVIGYTGTPWRGICSILGGFWSEEIKPAIDRNFLRDNGFTVPDTFGVTSEGYDLREFDKFESVQMDDMTSSELEKMHEKMPLSTTQRIMKEVHQIASQRNGVLVTCAGLKHCEEAAEGLPNGVKWAVITTHGIKTNTEYSTRKELVDAVKSGEIKYLLQIGVFTTGFNAPIIDTIVLLRRIGSLTLLEQLLGRGRRLLKQRQIDAGIVKNDSLVLDYSGTVDAMRQVLDDPILDEINISIAKRDDNFITCPDCGEHNSPYARRCIGKDLHGNRCEYFWSFKKCEDFKRGDFIVSEGCGTRNDPAARSCRACGNTLIDPNEKLTGKHYKDSDWKSIDKMSLEVIGKNQNGVRVKYFFDNYDSNNTQEIANVDYWAINENGKRVWKSKFLASHLAGGWPMINKVSNMKPIEVAANEKIFLTPKQGTHRINDKGKSIVNVR